MGRKSKKTSWPVPGGRHKPHPSAKQRKGFDKYAKEKAKRNGTNPPEKENEEK